MAVAYMNQVNTSQYKPHLTEVKAWDYKDELTAASNGTTVIVPADAKSIGIALIPSGPGSGKIQVTYDPYADVIAEAATVTWVDWDSGVVAAATQDGIAQAPTAVRQVNATGTTKMTIIARA